VKNQARCGSCWSFSTTGVVEGQWILSGHSPQSLSEQTLVSCDTDNGNAGCNGGFPYLAVDWIRRNGIDTEASYPYTSGAGAVASCTMRTNKTREIAAVNVTGFEILDVSSNISSEDNLMAFVAQYGPVAINVDAMTQLWWSYKGGIMDGCCNKATDHAVLITGFGEENDVPCESCALPAHCRALPSPPRRRCAACLDIASQSAAPSHPRFYFLVFFFFLSFLFSF
jgi:C1A family cysteine protease